MGFEIATPTQVDDRRNWDAAADAELKKIVATAPTAVVVDTSSSRADLTPGALRAAKAAGVRVVLIGSDDGKDVAGVVFQPPLADSAPVVDRIAADSPRAHVLVLSDPRFGGTTRKMTDAFGAHPGLVAVAGPMDVSETDLQQQDRIRATLHYDKRITAIIADNPKSAAVARAALVTDGAGKRVQLWAVGGYQDIPAAVQAGTMSGFVSNTPVTVGTKAVEIALGTRQSVDVIVPPLLVTRQSLPQFRAAALC